MVSLIKVMVGPVGSVLVGCISKAPSLRSQLLSLAISSSWEGQCVQDQGLNARAMDKTNSVTMFMVMDAN